MKKIFLYILDLLFPKKCAGCGASETYLCPNCLANLPAEDNPSSREVIAAFPYAHPTVRRSIWLLKYKGVREIAQIFAGVLYERFIEAIAEHELFFPADGKILVVPAPLAPRRLKARGFNQSGLIAESFASSDPAALDYHPEILHKIKETPAQVSVKSRAERLKNLEGAFTAGKKGKLKDRTVILIDDVSTTGTTMKECEKALRKAGAKRVIKMAVARG